MRIITAEEIREWDAYTIIKQGITSLELMERAAGACSEHLLESDLSGEILIFCGPGNNGGDGFALARLLHQKKIDVQVIEVWDNHAKRSEDNKTNRERLTKNVNCLPLHAFLKAYKQEKEPIIIDAIFGIGQNRALSGIYKQAVEWINLNSKKIISIDLPTGLFDVCHNPENPAIQASRTLTFETPKLPFFLPENEKYLGEWIILDIGLDKPFLQTKMSRFFYLTQKEIEASKLTRKKFAHKGSFGTAFLFAGQVGMCGAATLAAKACLRVGAGKLIIRTPKDCMHILQSSVPEAICDPDTNEDVLSSCPSDLTPYQSVGIGPGIGKSPLTKALVWKLLRNGVPNLVLDADALNIIAEEGWQNSIPPGAVLTPHVKEFERLWGNSADHFQRIMLASAKSVEQKIMIVLKGAHTVILCPDGTVTFNSTGNPGLAKAGTGDVLTGMITGILAQGYELSVGVKRAVFLHGHLADQLALNRDPESILASDLVNYIGISKL